MRTHLRRSYGPILAGLVLLAVAVPGTALAKGPTGARVEGPGMAEPIALDWESADPAINDLIDATGFWTLSNPATADQPAGELGPRYVVSFDLYTDDGSTKPMAMHVYPYAEPAPLVYVPTGQVAHGVGLVPEGWRTATTKLTTWFQANTPPPPVPEASAVPADAGDDEVAAGSASVPWLPIGLAAVLLLGAVPVIMRIARRPSRLSTT